MGGHFKDPESDEVKMRKSVQGLDNLREPTQFSGGLMSDVRGKREFQNLGA